MKNSPLDASGAPCTTPSIQMLPIDQIHNPPDHNRPIDPKHVEYLARSIARHDLQHPITVIESSRGFDVIAGLHRWTACKKLGHSEIACKLLDPATDPATLLEISISENASRKGETFSETLARIDHVMRIRNCSFEEAARDSNVHKSLASKCKRVEMGLCEEAKQLIHDHPEKLGISIAYAVARFARSHEAQARALNSVLSGDLTRDELVATLKRGSTTNKKIKLRLSFEGIAINLGIPESTSLETLISICGKLKALLDAEKKHGRLVRELPDHIGGKHVVP